MFSKNSIQRTLLVFQIVLAMILSSCASRGVRPIVDTEPVAASPKKHVGFVWNRWTESSESKIMINEGDVVDGRYLPRVLELDQDSSVQASMLQYQKWSSVAQISAIALAASLVCTGIGYIRTNDGSTTFPISTVNILWGVSGVALGATVFSLLKQEEYLSDALRVHNQRASTASVSTFESVQVGWRFEI